MVIFFLGLVYYFIYLMEETDMACKFRENFIFYPHLKKLFDANSEFTAEDAEKLNCVLSSLFEPPTFKDEKLSNFESYVKYIDKEKNELVYKVNLLGIGDQSDVKVNVLFNENVVLQVFAHNSEYDYNYSFTLEEKVDVDNSYLELYGGILTIKFKIKSVEECMRTLTFKR